MHYTLISEDGSQLFTFEGTLENAQQLAEDVFRADGVINDPGHWTEDIYQSEKVYRWIHI